MPAPTGNQNAKGHDGSNAGRKSAYEEMANAEFLAEMFFKERNVDEVRAIIEGKEGVKKYSVATALLAKALAGNERIMVEIFKKIYPDKSIQDINMTSKQDLEDALNALGKQVDGERDKAIQDRPSADNPEPGSDAGIQGDSGAKA